MGLKEINTENYKWIFPCLFFYFLLTLFIACEAHVDQPVSDSYGLFIYFLLKMMIQV